MNYNSKVGQFGEKLAEKYLADKGYRMIDRNLKLGYQEIDLIAKISGQVIFIEVKTRTNDFFGQADEAITSTKIKKLKKARNQYLAVNKVDPEKSRFDLVAINIDKKRKIAKIKHYKDIF